MLHVHHAEPRDGDDYTYEVQDILDVSTFGGVAELARTENEDLRDRLLRAQITCAQLTAIVNRLSAILSEGA